MAETWKPVVGFEGQYEVSDLGRVRSLDRVALYHHRDGYSGREILVRRRHKGRLLRPGPSNSGHLSVVLGRKNTKSVHALVLEAFVGPCPDGMECLHRNGIPYDNQLENLRWGTRTDNLLDAVAHGAKPVGSRHPFAKLKESDIPEIRRRAASVRPSVLAREFGVSAGVIRDIRKGKTWKHVA